MSDDKRDKEQEARLRQLFATMRRVDERQAPSFRLPAAPVRTRRWSWMPLAPALATAAAVAVAVLVLWPAGTATDDASDVSLVEWVAPTDSFLQFSGVSLADLGETTQLESDELWPSLPTDTLFESYEPSIDEEQQL